MPSFYTHYTFGKDLILNLSENIKNIINGNEKIFIFGNQGPDLFFFHIFSALKGSNPGTIMHNEKFKTIADNAKSKLKKTNIHSPSSAYFFGLSCHFLLDTTLHPTVNKIIKSNYTHLDIESEFDRFFMHKNGKNEFKLLQSELVPEPKISKYIYPVYAAYADVSETLIAKSIKDMKLVKKIFQARGKLKESFLLNTLKLIGKYDSFAGQVIRQEPFKESLESNKMLLELYNKAFKRAPKFLDDVYDYMYQGGIAPLEFEKDMNGV